MKAIPTFYNGIKFRSRLEAKWAAFFDNLKWHWEYEPFDLGGWIPDFMLIGKNRSTLVEVKPYTQTEEWEKTIEKCIKAQIKSNDNKELLLLGTCPNPSFHNIYFIGVVLGLMNERTWHDNPYSSFYPAIFNNYNGFGFLNSIESYEDRITGDYDGDHCISPALLEEIEPLWKDAVNKVQWRRP